MLPVILIRLYYLPLLSTLVLSNVGLMKSPRCWNRSRDNRGVTHTLELNYTVGWVSVGFWIIMCINWIQFIYQTFKCIVTVLLFGVNVWIVHTHQLEEMKLPIIHYMYEALFSLHLCILILTGLDYTANFQNKN